MAGVVPKTGMAGIVADLQNASECNRLIGKLLNHLEANPDDNYARFELLNLVKLYDTLKANLSTIVQ